MNRRGVSHAVRPADGGRTNSWAALASDSDSDSVCSVPAVAAPRTPQGKKVRVAPGAPKKTRVEDPLPTSQKEVGDLLAAIMARGGLIDGDPELAALDAPGAHWGDLIEGPLLVPAEPEDRPLRGTSAEFWAQPFTVNLDEYTMDVYDTRRLTDEEWNAMMSWLYWKGWWIDNAERDCVSAEPDDLPARYWCPPRPEEEPVRVKVVRWDADEPAAVVEAEPKAPKKKALRAAPVPVMRFCRATTCTEAGCRYVHGDTIPKMDRPCGFGAECGASDPTGLKRSQCIYMHPGEEWTADLCIHRP